MKMLRVLSFCVVALTAARVEAEDFFDRVDEALTFSVFDDQVRARLSGLMDLEEFNAAAGLLELARKVIALTGSSSEIEFRPLPEDDPKIRRPDISKARKLLGWQSRIILASGLVKTIDYFRQKL